MVALLSEFVVVPGKTRVVCDAFVPSTGDLSCMQTIVASYSDAPRRVLVLHVFGHEAHAMRFHEEVLPNLVQSVEAHIDIAVPARKVVVVGSTTAALAA